MDHRGTTRITRSRVASTHRRRLDGTTLAIGLRRNHGAMLIHVFSDRRNGGLIRATGTALLCQPPTVLISGGNRFKKPGKKFDGRG